MKFLTCSTEINNNLWNFQFIPNQNYYNLYTEFNWNLPSPCITQSLDSDSYFSKICWYEDLCSFSIFEGENIYIRGSLNDKYFFVRHPPISKHFKLVRSATKLSTLLLTMEVLPPANNIQVMPSKIVQFNHIQNKHPIKHERFYSTSK